MKNCYKKVRDERRASIRCHGCKNVGHYISECPREASKQAEEAERVVPPTGGEMAHFSSVRIDGRW